MRLSAVPIAFMILLFSMLTGVASAQEPTVSGNTFYFHFNSEIYHNANNSVIILDGADPTVPSESTPRIFEVAAAIRNATTIFGAVWIGSIAWFTQPLTEAGAVHGTASFRVWLSSDDVTPAFSGVGVGVAVLDQQNQTAGSYVYSYSYARGSILTPMPTKYSFNIGLDREIFAGQRLIFAVGLGSTTEGWRMKVLFDAPQYSSHAELPSNITVIPELPPALATLSAFAILILSLTVAQRKHPKVRGGMKQKDRR